MSAALPLLTEVGLVLEGVDRRWWGWAAVWCPISQRVFTVLDNALVSMDATGADRRVVYELGGDPDDRPTYSRVMVDGAFALLWAAETGDWLVVDLAQGRPVPTRVRGVVEGAWLREGVLYTVVNFEERREASGWDLRTGRQRWSVRWAESLLDRYPGERAEGFVTDGFFITNCRNGDGAKVTVLDTVASRSSFSVVAVNGEHALVRTPRGPLALFSLPRQALLATLDGLDPGIAGECVRPWGSDRFVIEPMGELYVFDASSRSLIAGAQIAPISRMLEDALCIGDRWLVVAEPDRPVQQRIEGAATVRVSDSTTRVPIVSNVRLGRALPLPSVDEDVERLRTIVAILDEEESDLSSARDRLLARGILPEGFDPRVRMHSEDGELSAFRWTNRSRRAWISAAYDARAIVECEALAREALERWRRWWPSDELPRTLWWTASKAPSVAEADAVWALLREAYFITRGRDAPTNERCLRYHELVERAALWAEASGFGLVIPGTDQRFSDAPSPYEPLLAMFSYGVSPLWNLGGGVLLGRALIDDESTARREQCAWRQ
ncbi:MAG: hypothetical protein U0269_31725 [Polyangiales bacterium]